MTAPAPTTAELLSAIHEAPPAAAGGSEEQERQRTNFLKAAAILHLFRPSELRARGGEGDAAPLIIDAAVPAIGWSAEGYWTLGNEARREALRDVSGVAELSRLRELNGSAPATDQQKLVDRWLKGVSLDPSAMTAAELTALRGLAEWGLERFAGFPPLEAIEHAWRRRVLVADFEKLAERFVGRGDELGRLREFVGHDHSSPVAGGPAVARRGRALMLLGTGGVGKSALVARFVLDMFDKRSVPFIYLALDDQTLSPAEPRTLIGAALRQLEIQLETLPPGRASRQSLDRLQAELESSYRTRQRARSRGSAADTKRGRVTALRERDFRLDKAFAEAIRSLSAGFGGEDEAPFLFVIDTFEEASYRPEPDLLLLYEMLEQLIATVPAMRLLLVGRAIPVGPSFGELEVDRLVLADLSHGDAAELLRMRGLDAATADQAVASFGGNPLTLRLVADVLQRDGEAPRPVGAASEEVIRGYLYRRVLNHIHDPVVRQLAHPGMVLRRITPEIIEEVLAPVCGVELNQPDQSAMLFHQLAREHSLVGRAADGALIYREEIRLPMLKLIEADAPEQVAELHRRAVDFYGRYSDDVSREEELYHLLMGSDPESVSYYGSRFPSRIASRLATSLDELPPKARVALAQLTRIRLDAADFEGATSAQEEARGVQDVLYALRVNEFERAADLLDREIPPGSALGPLKVRVLRELGRTEEAEVFASNQVAAFPPLGNRARLAELMWFAAQSATDAGKTEEWLRRLLPVAEKLAPLALVQVLTELAGMASDQSAGAASELARALALLPVGDIGQEERLVRLALSRIAPGHTEPWKRLAPDLMEGLPYTLADRPPEEIEKLADQIAASLEGSRKPELEKLVSAATDERHGTRWLYRLISLLEEQLRRPTTDPRVIAATRLAFAAERTTLGGSSLAGLDRFRDAWELDSPAESAS